MSTQREGREFGTPEQVEAAEKALAAFAEAHREAFQALQAVWKAHYLTVGHKKLGRWILGRDIVRVGPPK
ncbi:MAG: hypothetical protein HY331_02445 [Chloroflexi bacterium]|nr:hypothetical protein [Chloroflexota bacterium]